jgi:transcription-repair coupling factor (superfamily II helicase)
MRRYLILVVKYLKSKLKFNWDATTMNKMYWKNRFHFIQRNWMNLVFLMNLKLSRKKKVIKFKSLIKKTLQMMRMKACIRIKIILLLEAWILQTIPPKISTSNISIWAKKGNNIRIQIFLNKINKLNFYLSCHLFKWF